MADTFKPGSLVELTPIPAGSWFDRAGIAFRSILKRIAIFSREEARTGEIATEVARKLPQLGNIALEGLATEKHAKAEADYAAAELSRMELELKRETLEARVRQSKENAEKAAWETRSARADAFMKEVQLLQYMEDHGISMTFDEPDAVRFRKVKGDAPKLVNRLLSEGDRELLLELQNREKQ